MFGMKVDINNDSKDLKIIDTVLERYETDKHK